MTVLWLWRRELTYLSLFIIIAAILSYFIGYFIHMLVLILTFVIIRQVILLSRLERWLSRGAGGKVPTASGVWGDIYYHFYRIKKSEKNRKKKLGKIIDC
jgi:two-component system phosphate regulon sensor histidine kinase PhoR